MDTAKKLTTDQKQELVDIAAEVDRLRIRLLKVLNAEAHKAGQLSNAHNYMVGAMRELMQATN